MAESNTMDIEQVSTQTNKVQLHVGDRTYQNKKGDDVTAFSIGKLMPNGYFRGANFTREALTADNCKQAKFIVRNLQKLIDGK